MANRIEQEIVVKVIGGKDVGALAKQIKALEKEKAELVVTADTADAEQKLDEIDKQLTDLRTEKADLEVTAKVNQALDALDEVASRAKKAEAATEALGAALGRDLGAKADLDSVVSEFRQMGLSLDQITANADKLGAKLREVGQTSTGGLEGAFRRARSSVDDFGRSADSSKSVLANMIGNSVQDLGAVSGVAGSAGVALGQMGEYMADAAASGDKLGSILTSFGKVAGPIGAIAVVTAAVANEMKKMQAIDAFKEEQVEAWTEALKEGDGALSAIVDKLIEAGELQFVSSEGLFGTNFGATTRDALEFIDRAGLTMEEFFRIVELGPEAIAAWAAAQEAAKGHVYSTGAVVDAATAQWEAYTKAQEDNERAARLQGLSIEGINEVIEAGLDPLERYAGSFKLIMDDLRDGKADVEATRATINRLARDLGIPPSDVIAMAIAEIGRQADVNRDKVVAFIEGIGEAAADQAENIRDGADAMTEWATTTLEAQAALVELVGGFNVMARNGDAINAAFDLGNAPLDALAATKNVEDAIRDLGEFMRDEGVPDIFDPNDVDASAFLAKIESLRNPIQQKITEAFATGGPEAARQMAAGYLTQLVETFKGHLTRGQIEGLFPFLTDIEIDAILKVAVDQSSLALAQQSLAVLVGLEGESPWTATIALQLASGEITPQAAQALINEKLQGAGVKVPAALGPVAMTSALNEAQRTANRHPVVVPIEFRPIRGAYDQGGTVDGGGGIAGERGPEILNDRYVTTGPTYVPPGTKVTSRRRSAVILRRHDGRGLRRYDNGGIVAGGSRNVTVNVNAAVIGNRHDVMRAVAKAERDAERLLGTR